MYLVNLNIAHAQYEQQTKASRSNSWSCEISIIQSEIRQANCNSDMCSRHASFLIRIVGCRDSDTKRTNHIGSGGRNRIATEYIVCLPTSND